MSILIRGMDMPTTCTDCPLRIGKWCQPLKRNTGAWNRQDRAKDCPLVEVPKHGELIDRDEVADWIRSWIATDKYYHPYSKGKSIPTEEVQDILARIPTVIEGE